MIQGITVIDVMRDMGCELDKRATWSIGGRVVAEYRSRTGRLPPKDLRTKTCGEGVHCFAIYPESFRPHIERIIREEGVEAARQRNLWDAE